MRLYSACLVVGVATLTGVAAPQTVPVQDSSPIARASASEVLLDLIVLDKHGKPVRNLKAGDVQVFEDGFKQQVTSFRYVPAGEVQPNAPKNAKSGGLLPLHSLNLVCLVFHNLDPVARNRAFEVAGEFLKNDLPPDTFIGLFTLGTRLTPVFPFTQNRKELADAVPRAFSLPAVDVMKMSEAVLSANPTHVTFSEGGISIQGGEVSKTTLAGAEVSTDIGASTNRGEEATDRRDFSNITGMHETDKVINMIGQLGGVPGRKLVLLLTTGLLTTGDPERFQSMVDRAKASDITFYSIDVSGLTENSTSQAGDLALGQVANVSQSQTTGAATTTQVPMGNGGTMSIYNGVDLQQAKEKSRQSDTMNDAVRNSDVQASLRALAEDTGGFLVANTNDFRKPFQRIVDDIETHFELTYRPVSHSYDGRIRTISIKLSHPDWRAESRTAYLAMPALKDSAALLPHEVMGLMLLNGNRRPHAFDFHTATYQFRNSGTTRESLLVAELPTAEFAATPSGHDSFWLHCQLFSLIKDASGQVVDKFSVDAPYEIPADKLEAFQGTPLIFSHPLNLPPGRYTVDTVAIDRQGGTASTDTVHFDTSAAPTGLGMSSALLIQRIEPAPDGARGDLIFQGKRLTPVLTMLLPEVSPSAYFVVYPNKSNPAKPKVEIELRVDGSAASTQTLDLPEPDAAGAIPVIVRATLHTGHCELKITSVQGDEKVSRTLAYTVAQ